MTENPTLTTIDFKAVDLRHQLGHYRDLFWRYKWYILSAGPVFAALWILYVLHFSPNRPELEAKVILGFENPSDISAVQDIGVSSRGKLELIKSAHLLKSVVESLSLRLVVESMPRDALFDSVHVDSTVKAGQYQFRVKRDKDSSFVLTYSNKYKRIKNQIILKGALKDPGPCVLPGMFLRFTPEFIASPATVAFEVVSTQKAIKNILDNLSIQERTMMNGYASAILRGNDYRLIAKILNTLADAFIENNLNFRKGKTDVTLHLLQKQLETASTQLQASEQALRNFRQANPSVGLSEEIRRSITNREGVESSFHHLKEMERQILNLQTRGQTAIPDEKTFLTQEIVTFLVRQNISAATALQNELNSLFQERTRLQQNYAVDHPIYLKNEAEIQKLFPKVMALLDDFQRLNKEAVIRDSLTLDRMSERLQRLPQQEIQLVELQRQQQINSEINSNVLNRYNQAKILETVTVSDVFVLDYAVPPEPSANILKLAVKLFIGLALGFGLALGPVLLIDLFDQSARTEKDLRRMLGLPVLESIPVLETLSSPSLMLSRAAPSIQEAKPSSRDLQTAFANESFRSLRTRILLHLQPATPANLVVTSLNPNEGKSLIATNIAITLAQRKIKTLLIDADLRHGELHLAFNTRQTPGLSDFLLENGPVSDDAISSLLQATPVDQLSLIPAGEYSASPTELLSRTRLAELLEKLQSRFDIIVVDTPPLCVGSDAVALKQPSSRYILVVRAGRTNVPELLRRVNNYHGLLDGVLGAVLNRAGLGGKITDYKHYAAYYKPRAPRA